MGYELNKLMNKYGLGSASMPTAPSMPVAPKSTGVVATDTAAQAKYAADMEKWKDDKALQQQYKDLAMQRVANTNLYAPAQNRQILQAPIYSNMDVSKMPDVQKVAAKSAIQVLRDQGMSEPQIQILSSQGKLGQYEQQAGYARTPQYTVSSQSRSTNALPLPSLVSKYAAGMPGAAPGALQAGLPATTPATTPATNSTSAPAVTAGPPPTRVEWVTNESTGDQYPVTKVFGGYSDEGTPYYVTPPSSENAHGGIISLAKKYADGGAVAAPAAGFSGAKYTEDQKLTPEYQQYLQDRRASATFVSEAAKQQALAAYAKSLANMTAAEDYKNNGAYMSAVSNAAKTGYNGLTGAAATKAFMQDNPIEQLAAKYVAANTIITPAVKETAPIEAPAASNNTITPSEVVKIGEPSAPPPPAAVKETAPIEAPAASNNTITPSEVVKIGEPSAPPPPAAVTATDTSNVSDAIKKVDAGTMTAPALGGTTLTPPAEAPKLGDTQAEQTSQIVAPPPTAPPVVTDVATGAMSQAPAIGGVTVAPPKATPTLGAGTTVAPSTFKPVTVQNPVTNAIFSGLNMGKMAPITPASNNTLSNLFSSYATANAAQQSAQNRLTTDRQNYINSLYASGSYDPEAINQWDLSHRIGQGTYKYAHGGRVKTRYADGDLVDLGDGTESDSSAGSDPSAYDALVDKYQGVSAADLQAARADYRAKQQSMLDSLVKYQQSQAAQKPDKSEMYFRLAQAFLTPGRTGSFGESLAAASGVAADYNKEVAAQRRAEAAAMLQNDLKQKELMANMSEEDLKSLQSLQTTADQRQFLIDLAKARAASNVRVPSLPEIQKNLIGMGLKEGTPEFQKELKRLVYAKDNNTSTVTDGRKLSSTELDLKNKSESTLNALDQSLGILANVYELNKNSYGGSIPEMASYNLEHQLGSTDPKVLNTTELNNLLGKETLSQLKATFGSQFTAAEGAKLEALSGVGAKTTKERTRIFRDAYQLLKAKRDQEQARFNSISKGDYGITH